MDYMLKFSKLLLLSVLILKDIRCKEEYALNEISDDTISLSVIMISLISNTENYNQLFAQPTHATKVNTTDIDSAIVDMLNKISRGNVIDSTLNSIVSGMNVGTTQTNLSLPSS
jgi:hypothetical protein